MTHKEYNRKVQAMQRMFTDTRCRPLYSDGGNAAFPEGQLMRAYFEVHWDGRWHVVGTEKFPMTDKTEWGWDDEVEDKLCSQFTHSLMHS